MVNLAERENILNWSKKYCNNAKLTDADDFAYVIDKTIEAMEHAGVTSESMAGMSQSFGTNIGGFDIRSLLSPYKKLKSL